MIQWLLIFLFLVALTIVLVPAFCRRYPFVKPKIIYLLFFYHYFFGLIYYIYAIYNPSDSRAYFIKIMRNFRGPDWFSFYGTSTTFIEFLGYPLIKFANFSYESMMVLFAYFGFLGFMLFMVFFKENIKTNVKVFGMDAVTFIMFLPNFHFWTSSFGKGSVIFLGMALVFFSFRKLRGRFAYLFFGALIVYHVRPHIMFVVLISLVLGYLFSGSRIPVLQKSLIVITAAIVLAFIYKDVLVMTGLDEDFIADTQSLTERAKGLQRATSGVDLSNYNFAQKLFTFLYRPLFFDAPGLLGIFVSVENVVYVLLTVKISNVRFLKFIWNSSAMVKTCAISFITISLILAQISGNLGLAIRQKSQVMILFMFVIISFLDGEKVGAYQRAIKEQARRMRLAALRKEKAV